MRNAGREGRKRPSLYPAVFSRGVVDGPSPVRLMVHLCQIVHTERGEEGIAVDFLHSTSFYCLTDLRLAGHQQQFASSYWAGGGRTRTFLLHLSKAEIWILKLQILARCHILF